MLTSQGACYTFYMTYFSKHDFFKHHVKIYVTTYKSCNTNEDVTTV